MEDILRNYKKIDNIFSNEAEFRIDHQDTEFKLRSKIANKSYMNYLDEVFKHHSICVMDQYVELFLKGLQKNSIVLDVGSGWCWHWRNISKIRPDVKIIALDFIKNNFFHTENLLSKDSLKQINFLHDDFNNLKIENNSFDAIWSSQAFQHMKNLDYNFKKAYGLLKKDGYFYNFNLNESFFVKLKKIYKKKRYIENYYYLNRDINTQIKKLKKIFNTEPKVNYCEFFFHPEIKLTFGRENSKIYQLENFFSKIKIFNWMARQVLIKLKK